MTAKDEPIVAERINLDDVHTKAVHDFEENPAPAEVTPPVVDEPKAPEAVVVPPVTPPVEAPTIPLIPEPVVVKPVELDTDITKPADGKIAIKNSDGEMNYFNNLEEIPDDFEPASYKEFSKFNADMTRKTIADEQLSKDSELKAKAAENQKEIDAVTSAWDRDIDTLTKGGVLPEDTKAREAEIGDTYAYIAKKISDGVIVDSFAEAHKAMMYDKLVEAKKIVNDSRNRMTKDKGSLVMSGTGSPSTSAKVKEALPAGVTLDQVHARYSGLI